jgi:hypothetical protein
VTGEFRYIAGSEECEMQRIINSTHFKTTRPSIRTEYKPWQMQSLSITKVNILYMDGGWLNGDGDGERERFKYGKWKPSFLMTLQLSAVHLKTDANSNSSENISRNKDRVISYLFIYQYY